MEGEKAADGFGLAGVVGDVVGGEPVFVEPDVEQKNDDEAGEVEDVLLDGHGVMERRGRDA